LNRFRSVQPSGCWGGWNNAMSPQTISLPGRVDCPACLGSVDARAVPVSKATVNRTTTINPFFIREIIIVIVARSKINLSYDGLDLLDRRNL